MVILAGPFPAGSPAAAALAAAENGLYVAYALDPAVPACWLTDQTSFPYGGGSAQPL